MKLNWGKGIFLFFGIFVVFMLSLVYLASKQSHELVTEDYYEKELEFKEILKKEKRTHLLTEQLSWEIKENIITFSFPKEITSKISGTIIFFKPSHKKDDKEIPFQTSSNEFSIRINDFSKGMYKIKIDWKSNNTEYYNEVEIVIP